MVTFHTITMFSTLPVDDMPTLTVDMDVKIGDNDFESFDLLRLRIC